MEAFLLLIFLSLCAVAYGLVRVARRLYARRGAPQEAERSFLHAVLTPPPPKPPAKYTLRERVRPPDARGGQG